MVGFLLVISSYVGYRAAHLDPLNGLYDLHPTSASSETQIPFMSDQKMEMRRFVFAGTAIDESRRYLEKTFNGGAWKVACSGDTFEIFTSAKDPDNKQVGWFLFEDGHRFAKVIARMPYSKAKGWWGEFMERLHPSKSPIPTTVTPGFPVIGSKPTISLPYSSQTMDLMGAINEHNLDDAKKAIAAGADVNGGDDVTWSPIAMSLRLEDLTIARYLLDHGGNPNLTRQGQSLISSTTAAGNVEAVKLLLSHGARLDPSDPLPLILACNQSTPMDDLWDLDTGFEIDDGRAWQGSEEVVAFLLDKGFAVNGRAKASKQTALHKAAACGHLRLVELLLRRGADPSLRDVEGKTALDYAKINQRNEWRKIVYVLGDTLDKASVH